MVDAVAWQKQMPNRSAELTPEEQRGSRWVRAGQRPGALTCGFRSTVFDDEIFILLEIPLVAGHENQGG